MGRRSGHTHRQCAARRPAGQAGLSLVEVLVTLSIMSLASVLIITTARPYNPLLSEGERLSRTIEQLDARARISGKPTGLVVEPGGYGAVTWANGEWRALRGHSHTLNAKVRISESSSVTQSRRIKDKTPVVPTLIFDPLGHSRAVPLVLSAGDRDLVVAPLDAAAGRQ